MSVLPSEGGRGRALLCWYACVNVMHEFMIHSLVITVALGWGYCGACCVCVFLCASFLSSSLEPLDSDSVCFTLDLDAPAVRHYLFEICLL